MAEASLARPLALALVAAGLALGSTAGLAAAESDVVTHQRYVAGLSTSAHMPVPGHHTAAACVDDANVGGICDAEAPTETNLVVLVDDTALDRVPFHWQAHTPQGDTDPCPGGHTIGEDAFSLPAGCSQVDVYVSAPATEGTITIKHDDVVII